MCAAGMLGGSTQSCTSELFARCASRTDKRCADVDACVDFPCGEGASCSDLPPPAPNSPAGRNCTDINACIGFPCQSGNWLICLAGECDCLNQASPARICLRLLPTLRADETAPRIRASLLQRQQTARLDRALAQPLLATVASSPAILASSFSALR